MSDKVIVVEIIEWDSYQPRKDIKKSSWFRIDHDIVENDKILTLDPTEKWIFFYLLCCASKQNTSRPTINSEKASFFIPCFEKDVFRAIEKLKSLGIVRTLTLRGRYVDVSLHNKTEHNKTYTHTSQSSECKQEFDFNEIYNAYPRKLGRQRGEKLFKQQIKTREDFTSLARAVKNYANQMAAIDQPKQFIKQFDTFMGCWKDWANTPQENAQHEIANKRLSEEAARLEAEIEANVAQRAKRIAVTDDEIEREIAKCLTKSTS
jgi:hypothetical protein